jgi:hypothetical protein
MLLTLSDKTFIMHSPIGITSIANVTGNVEPYQRGTSHNLFNTSSLIVHSRCKTEQNLYLLLLIIAIETLLSDRFQRKPASIIREKRKYHRMHN